MAQPYRVQFFIVALIGLALPAVADAKAGYRVHPGSTELILPVEKAGGRIISISANSRQRVQFKVETPSSTIEYSTNGRVSNRHIEADFGALGQIAVKLKLSRFEPGVFRRQHCKGRDPIEGDGTYRGTIQFAGEGGIPEISGTRGRVYFERLFRQVCKRRSPRYEPNPFPKLTPEIEEGKLAVRGKGEGRTVRLDATIFAFRRNPAQSGGTFRITAYERRESVRIARWTDDFFDDSFVMSKHGKKPETVKVELPKPFAGRAVYSRSPGSPPSWTGDLSVDLPGGQGIHLAGLNFSASLCRGKVDSCRYSRKRFYSGPWRE